MTHDFSADARQRFVAGAAASIDLDGGRVVWPIEGQPAAFDDAASAMLGCFDEPLEPVEFAADLVAAVGMTPDEASAASASFISRLLGSGHLVPVGIPFDLGHQLEYPPSPST